MEWFNVALAPLKDLLAFLYKKSKTNDVHKRQLITELRDNLNVFKNGFLNHASYDSMIDLLSNQAIASAVAANFPFKKLKAGKLEGKHIREERNKKYVGWTTEQLVDKIDEKIVELKTIKKMNHHTVQGTKNNIALMMSNLYFRMKLLTDFIKSP